MNNKFSHIQIRGAKTHNLKNIDVDIALGKLTCLAGPSGSGKTSLAFHTIFQESKRRLINSFPSDIKFFWDIPQTADVDKIEPVLPVWSLPQHNPVVGARPSMGDLMGLTEKLQQLFFFLGMNHCPEHNLPYKKSKHWTKFASTLKQDDSVLHIFLDQTDYKTHLKTSIMPVRSFDDDIKAITGFRAEDKWWEITRIKSRDFKDKVETKLNEMELNHFHGDFRIISSDGKLDTVLSAVSERSCPKCHEAEAQEITHFNHLSPYNGIGACKECDGHGMILKYDREKLVKDPSLTTKDGAVSVMNYKSFLPWRNDMFKAFKRQGLDLDKPFKQLSEKKWKLLYEGDGAYPGFNDFFEYLESKRYKTHVRILIRSLKSEFLCPSCSGSRLSSKLNGYAIDANGLIFWHKIIGMNLGALLEQLTIIDKYCKKHPHFNKVSKVLADLLETAQTAISLGIENLNLSKKVKHLAAGQYQRVLLTKLLSFRGSGSLFVLDEPTLGLDENEIQKVIECLKDLRDQGNTVLVVEHAPDFLKACDEIIEMGPGAGIAGGSITYQGKPKVAGKYKFDIVKKKNFSNFIKVKDAPGPLDWCFDYEIPIEGITVVTGPSEGGKRQAVLELLENWSVDKDSVTAEIEVKQEFDKVISFAAEASKVTARSTVGTFLGLSTYIRKHFSELPVSKAMGLKEGHFSYNSELGKCPSCEGRGIIQIDMNFMEDVLLTCEDCKGMKLRTYYAQIRDGHQSYHEALNRPVLEAFSQVPTTAKAKKILAAMETLKLGHLSLDRSLQSLSGGERQRIKLLAQTLVRMKPSLLMFENISFGLSPIDLEAVYKYLQRLREQAHTLILVDQHPYLREMADISLEIQ